MQLAYAGRNVRVSVLQGKQVVPSHDMTPSNRGLIKNEDRTMDKKLVPLVDEHKQSHTYYSYELKWAIEQEDYRPMSAAEMQQEVDELAQEIDELGSITPEEHEWR